MEGGFSRQTLLEIIALSTVQSSFIHNAILFIDTSNNAWYNQSHWLIGTPYLLIIASNDTDFEKSTRVAPVTVYNKIGTKSFNQLNLINI